MVKIVNRKARYNYELLETFEAGLVLKGAEVKSIKNGRIRLDDAFVRIDQNQEAWLTNAHIPAYQFADNRNYNPDRSRKILLHKKEILSLFKKMEGKNLTIVPVSVYTKKNMIKLQLALAKGKKQWQKKEKKRSQDLQREMERELRKY
jgi:SsrA-binding protein